MTLVCHQVLQYKHHWYNQVENTEHDQFSNTKYLFKALLHRCSSKSFPFMCRSHALPQGKPAETLKTMPTALASNVWRPTTLTKMDMCYACRVCKLSADCHLHSNITRNSLPETNSKNACKGMLGRSWFENHLRPPKVIFFHNPKKIVCIAGPVVKTSPKPRAIWMWICSGCSSQDASHF